MTRQKHPDFSRGTLPAGERIYAIGDIHGEAATLARLLKIIANDIVHRDPARTTLVLLGDFIDRGSGAGDLLRLFSGLSNPRFITLKGNHESVLVDCYHGDDEALGFWMQFGGRSTLLGLGISEHKLNSLSDSALVAELQSCLSCSVVHWLDNLPLYLSLGGYFFTHAGVRPGVALHRQDEGDLLWIRDKFLSSTTDYSKVVVHGHTIEPGKPMLGRNRIGLDTGAHEHGVLSALGLEGSSQWILQATSDTVSATSQGPENLISDSISEIERLIEIITGQHTAKETESLTTYPQPFHLRGMSAGSRRAHKASRRIGLAALVAVGVAGWGTYVSVFGSSVSTLTAGQKVSSTSARAKHVSAVLPPSPIQIRPEETADTTILTQTNSNRHTGRKYAAPPKNKKTASATKL